ncbi:hypothetical protein S7711_07887 [Stachybotrys chartarum IBT 7711]|uniref:DUF6546 domain-containing protein n=1 Tax=Stachybotrys chartarum (strain CBS 109288 / IBT 7711) TaxID=1280523 RepID=A0A084AK09_STACB|nr:hypothetical protein S7711_07887 [Stachybotrys chartarum IBT 7711]
MSNASTSWAHLPPNIRHEVLSILPGLGGICSLLVTISREWQSVIEPLNFAEISLTIPRLSDPDSAKILFRKRSHIRYIWFRVELKQYKCELCAPEDGGPWGLDDADNILIADAFQRLLSTLSTWEPRSKLVLDISVYSPSDTRHWFKYLSFHPDTHLGECRPSEHEQGILMDDPAHGWVAGRQTVAPKWHAIEKVFEEIMGEGPFGDEETEMQWWQTLPPVPAVTDVLLRQQTRRRWKPIALTNMLTRFTDMKELCYEPWREWNGMERHTDQRTQTLIESLSETKLSKLTIFENFNQSYPGKYFECPAFRQPTPAVSHTLARASLQLSTLSASFMVDARYFFEAREDSWKWESLTCLALTSKVLTDDAEVADINGLLRGAAAAALNMPKLETLELWNGREGLAMLFRYQGPRDRQPAIITVRGTFELVLGSAVTQAWDAVARRHGHDRVVVQSSSIKPSRIRCHGDAICQLELLTEVIRPISLRQILNEHELRAGPAKWTRS